MFFWPLIIQTLVFSGFVESFLLSDGRHSRRWKYNWWEFLIVFCGTTREILVIFDCCWCPVATNVWILFCRKSFLTQFTNPFPKDFTQLGKEYPASRIIQINVKLNISTEKEWNSTKFWFWYCYGRFEGQQDKLRGKNILHLQPYHLFGFCLDCYIETQNSLDRSKLRLSQTPTIHPSEFFGHITFSVPNIKL